MKLRKKLLLSCAALAACATTLVSTSYAWYVSNSTASASNITGSTTSASTAGNLFVAHATSAGEVDGEYSPSIDFATKGHKVQNVLDPAHLETDGTWTDKFGAALTTDEYIEYSFFLWSTEEADVNVSMTAENTTGTLPSQTIYSSVGTGITAGNTLQLDAIYALRMSVKIGEADELYYDVAAVTGYTTGAPSADLNAHDYYAQVAGTEPTGKVVDEVSVLTSMDTWTVVPSATEGQLVTVRIWLEGADIHCFDACAGQTFEFNFEFSI